MITNESAMSYAGFYRLSPEGALYHLCQYGYRAERHEAYLAEIQMQLEPEYHAIKEPNPVPKKMQANLEKLKAWVVAQGEKAGISTEWGKHPDYGYTIAICTSKNAVI